MPKFRIAKEKEKQEDTIKQGDILILTEKSRGSRKGSRKGSRRGVQKGESTFCLHPFRTKVKITHAYGIDNSCLQSDSFAHQSITEKGK